MEDQKDSRLYFSRAIDLDQEFADAHYYLGKLLSGGVATDKEGTLVDKTNLPEAKEHFLKVLRKQLKKRKDQFKEAVFIFIITIHYHLLRVMWHQF